MKIFLLCFLLLSSGTVVIAQETYTDSTAEAAVQKLSFLVGEWQGHGWMTDREGNRHTFEQSEMIEFRLDSTLLLIEGRGESDGKVIHHALAMVSHDKEGGYEFRSSLANGRGGNFKGELVDGAFHWYPAENMRYIIRLNDQGQCHEIGEVDTGGTWHQFFEMVLTKKE